LECTAQWVRDFKALIVVNEAKAGSFNGFEDPDGNLLYLASLDWSHVEKGEGEYQPAILAA
jgi:hypothetical protein